MTEAVERTGPATADASAAPSRSTAATLSDTDRLPVALVALDRIGNVVDYNAAAARLLGEAPTGLLRLQSPFMALIGPSAREYVAWRAANASDSLTVSLRSGGRLISAQLTKSDLDDPSGSTIIAVHPDESTPEKVSHRLVFDLSEQGIFVAEVGGAIIAANPALVDMLTDDPADLHALVGANWQHVLLNGQPPAFTQSLHGELREERHWRGRVSPVVDGVGRRVYDVTLRMKPFDPGRGSEGAVPRRLVGYVDDVTDETSTERALRDQARRDALTGLLNRAGFLAELDDRFSEAQRNGSRLTSLYIDLDNFKNLNDHYGHRYGDVLLEAFAKRLRGALKSSDLIGRIGGDEFVVVFDPGLKPVTLENVVAKLRAKLLEDYQLHDLTYTCTASFGSADYPWDAATADELLEYADHAMYQAKSHGRNRHQRFDRAEFAGWVDREELIESIEAGIERMQFVPFYQPLFDTRTGGIVGAEALVRWVPPDEPDSIRLPAEFLPLIDASPASVHLGLRMFDQVLVHMRSWARTVGPIAVSINLSAGQLRSEDIISHVEQLARDYPDEITNLRVELVESAFYDGDPIIAENLTRLTELGITLSLDDFGTGHSSLLSLRAHEFSQVKIDRHFLAAIDSGQSEDRLVLESMIDLNRRLGLETVCEGVETDEQLSYVRELGCDVVQGFLLAHPMPKEDLRALLRAQRDDD